MCLLHHTSKPEHRHKAYAVYLDQNAAKIRRVCAANPKRDPIKP